MAVISLKLSEKYFIKDPFSTRLGQKLIHESIILIDELGYEEFTFKKLAYAISSTEASIYRYFENKYKLLLFLITYYWQHLDYLIDYHTHHMSDPAQKIGQIIRIISRIDIFLDENSPDIDIISIKRIVINELEKTYLIKQVDSINKEGMFRVYKSFCHKIALIVQEIAPDFEYSHAFTSTLIEASHRQTYFAQHLPALTEVQNGDDLEEQVCKFLVNLTERTLNTDIKL